MERALAENPSSQHWRPLGNYLAEKRFIDLVHLVIFKKTFGVPLAGL
jgi:hypothetical protein